MENLEERLKTQEAELVQLKEIIELNKQTIAKKKLGRPLKLNDPLTETVCFKITTDQRERLRVINDTDMTLSDFIRQLIFGSASK